MKLLVLVTVLTLTCAHELPEKNQVKRSYVCPPKFIRQGHRCYFFSKEPATWQDAYFQCRDMHSNIAIIKNANQDKHIRNFLSKKSLLQLERWLGGVYDWEQMTWKWGASGKPLSYSGFSNTVKEDKEQLRWHCIIMDPSLQYRWSSRSCVEQKHYICHTKMKTVGSKGKKKLQRQYNANKYNQLNEIPVPSIPDYLANSTQLKSNVPREINYKFEINTSLNDQALFASSPIAQRRKLRKRNKNISKYRLAQLKRNANGTVTAINNMGGKRRKNKKYKIKDDHEKHLSVQNITWRTYRKEDNSDNPLYPKPIVEEYNFIKEQ